MVQFFLVCECCGWNWNWKLAKLWRIPGFQPRKQRIFCHGWFEQCWILHRATRWRLLRYYSWLWPNNSCFRRKGIFQQSSGRWPRCCYLCWMLEYILNKYIPSGQSNLSEGDDPLWSTPAKVIIHKLRLEVSLVEQDNWMCFCSLLEIYIESWNLWFFHLFSMQLFNADATIIIVF